jgi:hypothetical protein
MVEIVTVHRPFFKKAGVAVHDETNDVTRIVVHKTPFGIALKLTPTLEQIVPVSVQKCNIPVYSAAERYS